MNEVRREPARAGVATAPRILVVEDEADLGLLLTYNLEAEGYFAETVERGDEAELRTRLTAPAHDLEQALYVSGALKTGRIMAKDEDVCLHCGLCAERCPTGAWDMERFLIDVAQAENTCCNH